jgi:serine/threonine-protein kinase
MNVHPAGHLIGGRYAVVSGALEPGGDAVVYLVEDSQSRAPAAVKVLAPGQPADRLERFQQEARVAASLKHPNLVRVLDQGLEADGAPFVVHERLKGVTLRDWMERRGRLAVRGALEFAIPVMGGLVAAHSVGAVHGQVRPESVVLFDPGRDPLVPRLLDFGLSALGGSSAYRSPEQLQGVADIDGRTDVWSMAVVLYEMLAGAPPFSAPTAEELAAQIVAAHPLGLAERSAEVPRDLCQVVHRALVADRELRPLNMRFFLEAVLACASLTPLFGGQKPEDLFTDSLLYRSGAGGPATSEEKPEWERKLHQQAQHERASRDAARPGGQPAAAGTGKSFPGGLALVALLVVLGVLAVGFFLFRTTGR